MHDFAGHKSEDTCISIFCVLYGSLPESTICHGACGKQRSKISQVKSGHSLCRATIGDVAICIYSSILLVTSSTGKSHEHGFTYVFKKKESLRKMKIWK